MNAIIEASIQVSRALVTLNRLNEIGMECGKHKLSHLVTPIAEHLCALDYAVRLAVDTCEPFEALDTIQGQCGELIRSAEIELNAEWN